MYKGRRYRIGGGTVPRKPDPSRSTISENLSTISEATNPPITSTPNAPVAVAGPSNRENLPPSQSTQPTQPSQSAASSQARSAIISNDDNFAIPPSQTMQPSRYISQRSARMRSQLTTTQQTPMTYFESVLCRCGVLLTARNSDVSYTLNCDHLKFVIKLRKELSSHPKYPENVQNFLNGLLDSMKNQTQLTKLLSECIITLPDSDVAKRSQESLMNDFLMIDFLQKDIISILMRKIKTLAIDETNASIMEIELLLVQLKFVDHLSHGEFVCEEVFDALETASDDARRIIIRSLEDIIDLTRHNDVIERLMQLLPNDADFLTADTIDTFGNMCLSPSTHSQICQKIIRYIKNNAPNDLLPCFTKFILKFSTEDVNRLREIIESLRSCVRFPDELPTTRSNIHKNQREVLFELLDTFVRDKNPVISNFANVGYRLVFGIESCDRKVLLSRLVGFVCERNAHALVMADSGIAANKTSQTDLTTSALMILSEINRKYPAEMKYNGLQVLRLLDYSSDFTLSQFRLVMNIICSIAYSEPPCEQLKDHIDLMVKKQVSSSIRNVKNRGIVGVVRVIDHMVWERVASQSVDLESSYSTIESLPTKLSKVAATYIDLAITSAQSCPKHLALFFDKLASVFVVRNTERSGYKINGPFLSWLMTLVSEYFEKNFVVDELPATSAQWELDMIRALNTDEETTNTETDSPTPISMNIAGTLLSPSGSALDSPTILASLFNLLRVLYFQRHDGILTLIDAILGAGVVLPSNVDPTADVDIFDEYGEDRGRRVLDMYFYTVNFWRECVSAYASQLTSTMRQKVLNRLTEILEWEQKIKETLANAPDDYVPPTCTFLTESAVSRSNLSRFKRIGVKKAGPKRKTQTTQVPNTANETVAETAADVTMQPTARMMPTKRGNDWSVNLNEFLRCMDPNILILFEEELVIKYPLPNEFVGTKLGLMEFKFLLEDLTQKVESIFGVRKFGPTVDSFQSIKFPAEFISDIVNILPKILNHFNDLAEHLKQINKKFNSTDSEDDTELDGSNDDLFSDEANLIKVCFGLCIRLLAALFSWPDFTDDVNKDILIRALKFISDSTDNLNDDENINELALAAIKTMIDKQEVAVDLHSAVYIFHLVQGLIKHVTAKDAYDAHVVPLCKNFLSRKWYSYDGREMHGAEANSLLEQLLKGYFKDAKFSFIRKNLQWMESELLTLLTKGGILETFPCVKLTNFPALYREAFVALIDAMHRKFDKNAQLSNQFKTWETSIAIIDTLLNIAKKANHSRVYFFYFKNTHAYIKLVLQHGMGSLELNLQRKIEDVIAFLQKLQSSTRFLHSLCCHSKNIKDTAVIALVPPLRETLSQIVYKVKAILAANSCSAVFWVGDLKNKDVNGDEILSQATSITRSTLSGDPTNDDGATTTEGSASGSSRKRRSASQKSKPKKRKLRSIHENNDDDEQAENESTNSSRSRCF